MAQHSPSCLSVFGKLRDKIWNGKPGFKAKLISAVSAQVLDHHALLLVEAMYKASLHTLSPVLRSIENHSLPVQYPELSIYQQKHYITLSHAENKYMRQNRGK